MARPKKTDKIVEEVKTESSEVVEKKEPTKKLIEVISVESNPKQQNKEKLDRFIKDETKLVKGRFRNYETPNGSSRIQVLKYKGVPMFDKTHFVCRGLDHYISFLIRY